MAGFIDISMIGDVELEKKLAALGDRATQLKAVRPSLRASAKRLKAEVVANLSGRVVQPKTGRLLAATQAQKVRALPRSRMVISVGFDFPTRIEMGIDADSKWFYPAHVEYGHPRAAPRPFIRSAVDRNRDSEYAAIGKQIGKTIERIARRAG